MKNGARVARAPSQLVVVLRLQAFDDAAAPMPVPTHIVTIPYFRLRRRRPCTTVAARIAPVAPSGGWRSRRPSVDLRRSRPRSRITASDCAANASFSSDPVEIVLLQAGSLQRGRNRFGPMPMISGGTPRTAKLTKRASGVRLNRHHAHRFAAAREDRVRFADADAIRRHRQRRDARRAETVDRHAADRLQACEQRAHARDVPLLGFRNRAADDRVFDQLRVEAGHLRHRRLERVDQQLVRARVLEDTARALPIGVRLAATMYASCNCLLI